VWGWVTAGRGKLRSDKTFRRKPKTAVALAETKTSRKYDE